MTVRGAHEGLRLDGGGRSIWWQRRSIWWQRGEGKGNEIRVGGETSEKQADGSRYGGGEARRQRSAARR